MTPAESRFVRHGVPFVALVVIGSFGLQKLLAGRLEARDAARTVEDPRAPARAQRRRRARRAMDVEGERRRLIEGRESEATYEMKPVWRPPGVEGGH